MLAFEEEKSPAVIRVVGVGGAGMNAIERMVGINIQGVELIAMNTDLQVLSRSSAHKKVHLGTKLTRGMGAGANPEIGEQAALEDREEIVNALRGSDMVFITAGMGGGTGTGAAPIVAEIARELKALTVGVVSLPFKSEGLRKMESARKGQDKLREKTDTLITIPNDSIFKVIDRTTNIRLAFKALDDVLAKAVTGISDIINTTGYVNVDFADVRTVMSNNGDAVIGLGDGTGSSRINDALNKAIHHPLLEGRSIEGATSVLLNISGSEDLSLHEFNEAQEKIHDMVSRDAQIIIGFVEKPEMEENVTITVIATGFRNNAATEKTPEKATSESMATSSVELPPNIYRIPRDPETVQQGLNFPSIDPGIDSLQIPAFMRKKNG